MDEWRSFNLYELYEFASGLSKPRSEFGSGYPFLSFKDVFYNYFVPRNLEALVRSDDKERVRCSVQRGDVFLTRTSETMEELGMSCVALRDIPEATFNGFTKRLRPKSDRIVLPEYAGYFFRSPVFREDVMSMTTMSTRASLNNEMLARLTMKVPPAHVQSAIGGMLLALDDKIELNRRMNETLEAMARALFKDWFVDFGPTRAKAEGRAPYLAPEIWDLFPDALDDEDKPVGWTLGTLADVAESPRRGISPADVTEDTPYIGLEHMPRRSIALSGWEGAGKVTSNKSIFKKGEFLFGKLRPYFHKVGFAPLDGICSTDIVVVVPRAPEWGAFTISCLSSDEFVNYTDQTSTGTKMPRTTWKTMGQYKACLPSEQVVRCFQRMAQPLLDRVSTNIHEARTLAQTRDLLLPKLMSGEIRLRDAEKAVEAVA